MALWARWQMSLPDVAVFTIPWNGRSRCVESVITTRGTGDHDALEWVITMPWNSCSRWRGARRIDGLARVCREVLAADPFSGCVFVFRNRRHTALRLLCYD